MTTKITYKFESLVWKYDGAGSWFFVSLPTDLSYEIRNLLKKQEEGWGRMKVIATIGQNQWKTAIWFDTKRNTYLLPVKAEIRKKENIQCDDLVCVSLLL